MFCSKAWKQRNEVFHDSENYRKFAIDWHKKLKVKIGLKWESTWESKRQTLRSATIVALDCGTLQRGKWQKHCERENKWDKELF